MTARLAFAFVAALTVSVIGLYAMYRYDQRQWRRCANPECKRTKFYDWPEGRFCKGCGRKW